MAPIPVTVMIGSMGTDTAHVVSQLVKTDEGGRVTAIIPRKSGKRKRQRPAPGFVQTQEKLIRLGKGCSCCTVRSDVMSKVKEIVAEQSADHIVIQTAPMSDLTTLAKTFTVEDEDGSVLSKVAQLQTMSIVIDGNTFLSSLEGAAGRSLIERVEFANVVIITGGEGLDPRVLAQVKTTLAALNSEARIVQSHDALAVSSLQATSPFSLDAVQRRVAGRGSAANNQSTEEVVRFRYQGRRPFHPGRLHALLAEPWPGVLRVNGGFWVASQPHLACLLDVAGTDRRTGVDGQWWATVSEEERPNSAALKEYLSNIWDPDFGDRHHDISVVGVEVDEMSLRDRFDACLVTDEELLARETWSELAHPFPWPKKKG